MIFMNIRLKSAWVSLRLMQLVVASLSGANIALHGYATSTRPHTIGCGRPQSEESSTCLHARLTRSYHPNGQTNDPARSRSQGHRSRLTQSDTLMAPCWYYTSLSLRSGNQQILTGLLHRVLVRCLSEGPAIPAKFQTGRRQSSETPRKKCQNTRLFHRKNSTDSSWTESRQQIKAPRHKHQKQAGSRSDLPKRSQQRIARRPKSTQLKNIDKKRKKTCAHL